MSGLESKIKESANFTEAVSELARQARRLLREDDGQMIVNAHGIFIDPRKRRDQLEAAGEAINKALTLIDAAPWPSRADYHDAWRSRLELTSTVASPKHSERDSSLWSVLTLLARKARKRLLPIP